MSDLIEVENKSDPALLVYPATLPVELALRTAPIRVICESYGITKEEWEELRHDEMFLADVRRAKEALSKDGMGFRMKAKLQAEELLKQAWVMIHAPADANVPASVKADLIKFVTRVAGYDNIPKEGGTNVNALSIQISL